MPNHKHVEVINALSEELDGDKKLPIILKQALIHRSWINEHHPRDHRQWERSNERLEFLGDAVLGLIITEKLYQSYKHENEGKLSKAKSYLISAPVLAMVAEKLNLGQGLLLGRGELKTGGQKRESLLADAMEAVIGAIYLSLGLEQTRKFILKYWCDPLKKVQSSRADQDFKTELQEITQKYISQLPIYDVVTVSGPDHDKRYDVVVTIKNEDYGHGQGRSKKEAEQKAAKCAIDKLKQQIMTIGEDK